MPVLSPHRTSASGLSGSYRSSYNSSALDRPFFGSSSYNPSRSSTYSERFISRSYTDSTGRRIYSRSGSITEDGITTTRYREESREPSLSRDSGISSIREGSLSEYPRRESSLSRSERASAVDVIDSVAELRNKYSPANYVPACMRRNENVARSKSINDIGLPPIESKSARKKVNERVLESGIRTNNSSVSPSNNTNTDDDNSIKDEDLNGNRESVANLCKKFDDTLARSAEHSGNVVKGKTDGGGSSKKSTSGLSAVKNKSNSKLEVNGEENHGNGTEIDREQLTPGENSSCSSSSSTSSSSRSNSRVNDFASYISTRDFQKGDENSSDSTDKSKNDMDNKESCVGKNAQLNDVSTSPKRNRSVVSPSNSLSTSVSTRRSTDRECGTPGNYRQRALHDYSDDDSGGERSSYAYNSTIRSPSSPVKVLGLNGLKNIGNTCFMNSVIQCLSHTRWLLEYLRNDAYLKDINTTISGMKGALIRAFAEVIKELWSEDASDRVVNTVSLKSQIQRFAPRFIGYAQQDAQEFLRYLLEGLHEDVNRVVEKPKPILTEIDDKLSDNEKAQESWSRYLRMDNSKIVDHFVGQLKSTLRCTYCGHCSVTFDPFWDLSLPIPQRTGQLRLAQCLDSFTREETLDGDEKPTCSKCKERRKCTKSLSIHKFPKILVIHLKRFSPTERFRGKLNVTVDFPLDGLDMSNYAADGTAPCRYDLYAISNHSGTTYSGHYTAYCRHPYSNMWHEYNDSRVSSISSKSIVSGEAYVLFYQQQGSKSHL